MILRYYPNGMRYLLYHSNDTLERQYGLNQYDFGARWYDPARPGTTTMDPLCEQRPWESPYAHCANNPVNNIDPTGMDIWMIDERGSIQSYEKTMDFDAVRIVDGQGNTMLGENGIPKEIQFDYGTIIEQKTYLYNKNTSYDIYKVRGDKNAQNLFEFFADNITHNTKNEFSWVQTGIAGTRGLNFISTSHEMGRETGLTGLIKGQLQYDYTIRSITHSHPVSKEFSGGDIGFIQDVQALNIKAFYIYHTPSKEYIPFCK